MDPIIELITNYTELNTSEIRELSETPSALEFMRQVSTNRPFVVRQGVKDWRAVKFWTKEYLQDKLKGHTIRVAVTPQGKADSPILNTQDQLLFVKPWEDIQHFDQFLAFISQQELHDGGCEPKEVRYAQSQNDNLRSEYASLLADVETDVPWARIALQAHPEAINLWIGNSRSVTALHKDNYENVYCQIIGEKHFVLIPPIAQACVSERNLPPASYRYESGIWTIEEEFGGASVPFPTWDPDEPATRATRYSKLIKPMRVTLQAGDVLYLPAMWYHKVSQTCSDEGICCALNFWYDMSFEGHFFSMCSFARSVAMSQLEIEDDKSS